MADREIGTFLTGAELADLTDFKQAGRQLRWLRDHGWAHEVGATGRPKVARSYFNMRMGGTFMPTGSATERVGPDPHALDALQHTS